MTELHISWDDYHAKIEQLAVKVYQSQWEFNQILCLARGGLRIGDILSRIYNRPLAILSVSSYSGEEGNVRGELHFARSITMSTKQLGDRVLLVDDLVDSGVTLKETLVWLKQHPEYAIADVKTAVLWYKACSVIAPDFYVDYLSDSPWIHQPFGRYEQIKPEDLLP
ncbi:phosphoribosyltransferase family protein [Tumidithrix elongata RA019]|uniref:Phosphoribosyltransferase family protein n=1 Tax=Tumidithrix elongata BACA0141 TaxID=2716417 RepID=A0AAW9Q243_9CYAN|nr:phosphoribosyltransferase family protein [Tumidithrix elongata RA019]